MFEDVWATLQDTVKGGLADALLVATSEPFVIRRCREQGVPCLMESAQRSHSDSVAAATQWAMQLGATSLLSVAIDTPAATRDEIATLASLRSSYSLVVAPDAEGAGTNALLRTPPDAIAPRFGPGSCRLHTDQAKAGSLPYIVLSLPGIAADIDTPEDVERFLHVTSCAGRDCRTALLLQEFMAARRGVEVCS
jgi:2-phospho-L-lactate guanylyltransferase